MYNMRNRDTSYTEQKHEALFLYYAKILKDNGALASQLTRKALCAEAAKPFFLSPQVAQYIINSFISGKRKVNNLMTEEEFNDFIKMRNSVYGKKNRR